LRTIYDQAARLAASEIGVLIHGETGTGKELLARFLHASSGLAEDRLVALNCAALPVDLLEAELFGIDKGVATGVSERAGRFEQADGGTLFLDEIGDMALETQAKILRVLQEKHVFRVGSSKPRPARVRVISATNRDLEAMVENGEFRRDLYHRLADWTAELPPLRRRREDIANLAAHFLAAEMRRQGKRFGGLSEAAVTVMRRYAWPGNVRELEREMLRCSLFLDSGEPLQSDQLQPRFHRASSDAGDVTLKAQLERAEAAAIREALAEAEGDIEAAATRLGCGKSTLYRRISQLGVES
ncbi:MAG: sigma 54-interacting transcriptional regulator, partial [Pseudomonadota bacterium]